MNKKPILGSLREFMVPSFELALRARQVRAGVMLRFAIAHTHDD